MDSLLAIHIHTFLFLGGFLKMESKNKMWRFSSEDEFLDYAIEYVTNHIDNMVERIDTFDKSKKLKSKIKDYYGYKS